MSAQAIALLKQAIAILEKGAASARPAAVPPKAQTVAPIARPAAPRPTLATPKAPVVKATPPAQDTVYSAGDFTGGPGRWSVKFGQIQLYRAGSDDSETVPGLFARGFPLVLTEDGAKTDWQTLFAYIRYAPDKWTPKILEKIFESLTSPEWAAIGGRALSASGQATVESKISDILAEVSAQPEPEPAPAGDLDDGLGDFDDPIL